MTTQRGTNHFASKYAAVRYYRPYFEGTQEQLVQHVETKIREGDICIGRPNVTAEEIFQLDTDGRYHIITIDTRKETKKCGR